MMKINGLGHRMLHSLISQDKETVNVKQQENVVSANDVPFEVYVSEAQILKTNYANSMFIKEIKKSEKGGLTEFETAAVNSAETLKKYGTQGVPLKYSRKDFVKNLNEILKDRPKKEQEKIYSKLKISKAEHQDGYNGIISLGNLDMKNPVEKKVFDEGYKFIYQNEAKTGDKETDKFINTLIKGMPEFVNVAGKQQHKHHDYSVDLHSLQVMSNIISDPEFQDLSDDGKFILKTTALLHDIGKDEFVTDRSHPLKSFALSKPIVEKYNLDHKTENRLLNSIKNHQWLQWYNTSYDPKEIAEELADDYTSKEDYKMALIMARADLKATSDYINGLYSHCLDDEPQRAMRETVNAKFDR